MLGYSNLLLRSHKELDLTIQADVKDFFQQEKPSYVILAAAKVGGIHASNTYPADFIYQNMMIESNVIHAAFENQCQTFIAFRQYLYLSKMCRPADA